MKCDTKKKSENVRAAFKAQAEAAEYNWRCFFDKTFETLGEYRMLDVWSNYETCTTWCKFEFNNELYDVVFELARVGKDWSVKELNFTVFGTDLHMASVIRKYLLDVLKNVQERMENEK